jgi:hypothetical protein
MILWSWLVFPIGSFNNKSQECNFVSYFQKKFGADFDLEVLECDPDLAATDKGQIQRWLLLGLHSKI